MGTRRWRRLEGNGVGGVLFVLAVRNLLITRRFSREGGSRIASRVLASCCGTRFNVQLIRLFWRVLGARASAFV